MNLFAGRDLDLDHVTAILPDRVVDNAAVVIREGIVEAVGERHRPLSGALDGRGMLCAPGLVDTHSDGLEKERHPRPGVELPLAFALRSFEGRAVGAGVTTMFHGVGFADHDRYGRSVSLAHEMCRTIDARSGATGAPLDHRVLHRLDARDPDGFAAVGRVVDGWTGAEPPLVSCEDHTPGQGQYRDRVWLERYVAETRGLTMDQARRQVDADEAARAELAAHRAPIRAWLGEQARAGAVRLLCHDPVDAEEIALAHQDGATIAEFPTTIEAARAARVHGLAIVCGAPNALRGTSHSGNVSARELIAAGLCDVLASDYLPSTLLGAVGALVHDGVCDLARAVALVTAGPAAAVGLPDRGRLEPGRRGDLVLFDLRHGLPSVALTIHQTNQDGVADPRLTRSAS